MSNSEGDDPPRAHDPLGRSDVVDDLADHSDPQLVMGVARGSHDALAEIYSRHGARVGGVARHLLVADRADAVVQDVFLWLWETPARFDPARGSLRGFLVMQTHSRAIDLLRSDRVRHTSETADVLDRSSSPPVVDEQALVHLAGDQAWRLLSGLGEGERDAIALAYFGGHTYREVARLLDQPNETIRSHIRSGLSKLRAALSTTELERTTHAEQAT